MGLYIWGLELRHHLAYAVVQEMVLVFAEMDVDCLTYDTSLNLISGCKKIFTIFFGSFFTVFYDW